jgi:hypothetical protein
VVDRLKAEIPAYCPVDTSYKIHRRDPTKTKRLVETPLFPGYAFAEDTPESRSADIKKILGPTMEARWMAFNDKFLIVSDGDMRRVRDMEQSIRDLTALSPRGKVWRLGDSVTILRGILAGAMGTIIDMRNRRAFVAMKGKTPVFVDVAILG